jgi:hypothetical protein
MKNLAQRLIFGADCSQSIGLPPVLKIRRFKNIFFQDQASRLSKIQNYPKSKIVQNRYLSGTVCTRIQYMGGGGGGRKDPPLKKRDA